MLPGQPSQTLLVPAVRRAAHQLLDRPLIFNDPIAVGLVPEASEHEIRNALEDHRRWEAMLLRSLFALRSRFAEDRLAEAAARGVRQYVILGAGLDTFPWRQPDFARDMRIFAADRIATLAWTQVRFWERGLPKPANLSFVPVDLEEHQLGECLSEFGFKQETPSFFSVLGVIQYLEHDAVEALLRFASLLRAGSEIVFSFILPDDEIIGDEGDLTIGLVAPAQATGEPWKSRLQPRKLVELLSRFGFSDIFHLTPELAQERYFAGRKDGLRAPRLAQLIAAIV
jgi:methyltransferase (TIGR00027 family)